MTSATPADPIGRPPLHLLEDEAETLSNLALQIDRKQPMLSALLLEEIERAELHSASDLPPRVITMNASVTFVDEGNGARRTVTLVYPQDADIAAGRISVLTPIGAGLIGMAEGSVISWPDRDGCEHRLRIERVTS